MSKKAIYSIVSLLIIASIAAFFYFFTEIEFKKPAFLASNNSQSDDSSDKKATLDFYIMSQCPYGTQVEDGVAPVVKKMGDAFNLNINYILYPATNYAGEEETYCIDGLCSMHGTPEVKGNIVQLCVKESAPKKHMEFISCQNKDMQSIPDNWEKCAQDLELDTDKIKTCYEGEEGIKLLAENKLLADAVNATGSPTIYLNDKQYESGRDSLSFQRAICAEINNEHAECKALPVCAQNTDCNAEAEKIGKCINPGEKNASCEYSEATPVSLTILTDSRCTKPECQSAPVLEQIKQAFKGIQVVQELDYSSEEGKTLYEATSVKFLPAFLFGAEIKDAYFYADLSNYLEEKGEYNSLMVGANFDPTKEICDNEVDDNADGLTDCDAPDCSGDLACREEAKGRLDLFVMSQCPYGTKALDAMPPILDAFKDELDFNIHYIATETEAGKFDSLHGQAEVDENIRELCVIKNYPDNYQYMDYISCRNQNITSAEWESCASDNGMTVDTIKTCSEGAEGIALHSENIKFANELQVQASPTWLSNNKRQFNGIDAASVQKEICTDNPELKGCSVELPGAAAGAAAVPAGSCG